MNSKYNKLTNLPHFQTVGERLAWAREQRGLTQQELAELINKKQQYISYIESNKTDRPRKLTELAKVLNVNEAWLTVGHEELSAMTREQIEVALDWGNIPEPERSTIAQLIKHASNKKKE